MTDQITIGVGKRSGQPCVRGLGITVWDVLSWLASGMTEQGILGTLLDENSSSHIKTGLSP